MSLDAADGEDGSLSPVYDYSDDVEPTPSALTSTGGATHIDARSVHTNSNAAGALPAVTSSQQQRDTIILVSQEYNDDGGGSGSGSQIIGEPTPSTIVSTSQISAPPSTAPQASPPGSASSPASHPLTPQSTANTRATAPLPPSASSVRTMVSSTAITIVDEGDEAGGSQTVMNSQAPAQPRNLTHAFTPIELSPPSPTEAAPTQAAPPPLPTPAARTSWPIGYTKSSAGSQSSSSQKSRTSNSSGMKRKSTTPSAVPPTSTETGSRFAPCPVCEKTVALFEMDRHLDKECGRDVVASSTTTPSANSAKSKVQKRDGDHDVKGKLKRTGSSDVQAVSAASTSSVSLVGSSFTYCPLCDLSVPIATINHHMDVECGKEMKKPTPTKPIADTAVANAAPPLNSDQSSTESHAMQIDSVGTSSSSSLAAPPSVTQSGKPAHDIFTSGPLAASAFVQQRKGRNDAVKCEILAHFTLGTVQNNATAAITTAAASTASPLDQYQYEWQDYPTSGDCTYAPQSFPLSAISSYTLNTKCHEPSIEMWADIQIHATNLALSSSAVGANGATIMDFTSSDLLCNAKQPYRFRLSPSMLKSLLQKNVRLSRPAAAVRVALQLMCTDLNAFVRRLCVIMLEDGILHPHTPFLVWMTLACGKQNAQHPFHPTHAHVNALLQMVHDISSMSTRDPLLHGEMSRHLDQPAQAKLHPAAGEDASDEEEMKEGVQHPYERDSAPITTSSCVPPTLIDLLPTLTPAQRTLVKCLLVRARFGGSSFDVAMIRSYAGLWCKRFQTENHQLQQQQKHGGANATSEVRRWLPFLADLHATSPSHLPEKLLHTTPVDVRHVTYLQDDDLVLSAIDMHCSPLVEQLLKKASIRQVFIENGVKDASTHATILRELIWTCRSSLTNKTTLRSDPTPPVSTLHSTLYSALRVEIDLTSKRILQQRMEYEATE